MNSLIRRSLVALSAVSLAFTAAACSPEATGRASGGSASGSGPITIKHDLGETTLKEKPKNIVSTSIVLTGSLLAIEAPVKGSGASAPGMPGFDEQGFFSYWSPVAKERGVKALYAKNQLDLEAITAAKPDLIIMSSSGGDSTKDNYEQLKAIAPTVSVNYLTQSWQDVTKQLGQATGLSTKADEIVAGYDKEVAELKKKTAAPTEPVQAIVFNGENGSAFALPDGPHDKVFSAMGFTLAPVDTTKAKNPGGKNRKDVAFLSAENSVSALTSKNLLLIDGTEDTVAKLKVAPGYATVPAASTEGKIVPLQPSSFKMDYYSALEMARTLAKAFPA
ncbi:Fe2+-enterobactin ABC transporter substrate-binding protein [Austwickia chelonae]|uniref:Fe2+-enterobactin ABC transporter substrate-binding protein n=1 Tax=Austwickia chelonae TaxID=100225 RepID=UPI001F080D4B|nr:Fe2+-enterobactin ABC transporter substrate-binding protein [Austwickia chelonae]